MSEKAGADLTESVAANGQTVPAEVRPIRQGTGKSATLRFELLHGHRRYRAILSLKGEHLRATVRQADDAEAARIVLSENQARRDLTPLEVARAAAALVDGGMTQGDAGQIIGRSQPNVANMLRVLEVIPAAILSRVEAREISFSALRPLLPHTTKVKGKGTHTHPEDLARIVDRVVPHSVTPAERFRPEIVSEDQVQRTVRSRLVGEFTNHIGGEPLVKWRPLDAKAAKLYEANHPGGRKRPDMEAYTSRAGAECVHDFGPLGVWACDHAAWKHASDAEKRARVKRNGGQKAAPKAEGDGQADAGRKAAKADIAALAKLIAAEHGEAPGAGPSTAAIDLRRAYPAHNTHGPLGELLRGPHSVQAVSDGALFASTGESYAVNVQNAVAILDPFLPDFIDGAAAECDACPKGRTVVILEGKRGGVHTVPACANMPCLGEKLEAGRLVREGAVELERMAERQAIENARAAFPTLTRDVAVFLLATIGSIGSAPGEHDQEHFDPRFTRNIGRIHLREVLRDRHGDAILAPTEVWPEGGGVNPDALAEAVADKSDRELSEMLYDLAIDALTDARPGEYFMSRVGPYVDPIGHFDRIPTEDAEAEAEAPESDEQIADRHRRDAVARTVALFVEDGGKCPLCGPRARKQWESGPKALHHVHHVHRAAFADWQDAGEPDAVKVAQAEAETEAPAEAPEGQYPNLSRGAVDRLRKAVADGKGEAVYAEMCETIREMPDADEALAQLEAVRLEAEKEAPETAETEAPEAPEAADEDAQLAAAMMASEVGDYCVVCTMGETLAGDVVPYEGKMHRTAVCQAEDCGATYITGEVVGDAPERSLPPDGDEPEAETADEPLAGSEAAEAEAERSDAQAIRDTLALYETADGERPCPICQKATNPHHGTRNARGMRAHLSRSHRDLYILATG